MHPVGPRSSGVYWMRRMLVAVVAVAVVAGVVWYVVGRAEGPGVDPASENTTTTGTSQMTGVLASEVSSAPEDSTDTRAASTKTGTTAKTTPATAKTAADKKASDKKSGDKKAGDKKASDKKASDKKASDKKAGDKKAGDKKAGDKKASDKKASDKEASDKEASDKKASDKKASDKKAGDKKSGDEKAGSTTTKSTKTTPTTTAPPKPSYDKQGRLLCPDAAIKIVATTGAPSYPAGSQPILGMTVTNTGSKACVRDLSGPLQVYTVYSQAGKRLWSTDDCFPGEGTDVRQIEPGQTIPYNIKWSGTTSTPGCDTPRTPVGPGSYTVVAKLGTLTSKPHAFTIN